MTFALSLTGSGTARGLAHGEAARELIVEAAARWRAQVGADCERVVAALVDRSGFLGAAALVVPDLVDEIEGVARASGVDRRTVWALNLMDEEWWLRQQLAAGNACSGFGVNPGPGQPALVAQNMDLPAWLDGLQVLLDIRPSDGPRVLAPSYAGMVATNALNEHGIGVCVNTLSQLQTSTDGLPVALMIRHLADQRTHTEAVAALRSVPHASGQNYIVGSPDGVVDIECGADGCMTCALSAGRVAHTNHPLESGATDAPQGFLSNSGVRLDALRRRLDDVDKVGLPEAAAILRDAPLCRGSDGDTGFTFYSVVMELTAAPVLHLTGGPPSDHDYVTYGFG